MKKRSYKVRFFCLLLTAVMGLLAGCAGGSGGEGNTGNTAQGSGNSSEGSGKEQTGDVAMGRYVESEMDLTEFLEVPTGITRLEDGRLLITDKYKDFQVSSDGGASWETLSYGWHVRMRAEETYIMDVKAASDGTIGVVYDNGTEEEIEAGILKTACLLAFPDGTQVEIEVPVTEEEVFVRDIYLTDNGRYFANANQGIYELFADGTSKKFLTLDFYADSVQFVGNLMILDGYPREGKPVLYDIEKKEFVEDEVLAEFVEEYYKERESYNGGEWADLYFFAGGENVLYLAGKKGLHRHVTGGASIEQVVDGGLSRLSNPAYGLVSVTALENDEFLALFAGGKLVRYTYNPDMPSVPQGKLKVYSLEESDVLRQAVSAYQIQNPEVYVEYEIGMEAGDSVTREDALKKLNTKIMAGEGPDLLLLDGLPIDSYQEKGLLLELDGIWEEIKEQTPMFENIAEALRIQDGLYMLPGKLSLPLVEGRPEYVDNMEDLASTAKVFQKLRADNPGRLLLTRQSAKEIMKLFALVSEPAWKTPEGELNREALEEFLTYTKEIYETQMQGLDEETLTSVKESQEDRIDSSGEDYVYESMFYGINEMMYVGGEQALAAGLLSYPYGYHSLCSVQRVEGFEEDKILPMKGQSSGVFMPQDMLGISAASDNRDKAADFMKLYLGTDFQASLEEFSINREAFEQSFIPNPDYVSEDGFYGSSCMSDGDGILINLDVYVADEKQLAEIEGFFEAANTPYIEDIVLEKAVFTNGEAYIQGEAGIEEVLNRIEQEMEIYLAE